MTKAENRTPAGRGGCGCDRAAFTQRQNRQRRREGRTTVNTGKFRAVKEIGDTAQTVAARIAALDNPLRLRGLVLDFADAAQEFAATVAGWVAERDALTRTTHLADEPGKRRTAVTKLVDMAPRPVLPEITDKMITNGTWVAALTEMAEPVNAPLAELLANAHPPNAHQLRGSLSRSERLDRLLHNTIDRATLALERALDRAEARPRKTPTTADPRAELAALGVQI